jgi:hypothetical protein
LQERVLRPALVTVSKGAAGGTSDAAGSSAAEQSANT